MGVDLRLGKSAEHRRRDVPGLQLFRALHITRDVQVVAVLTNLITRNGTGERRIIRLAGNPSVGDTSDIASRQAVLLALLHA